MATVHFGRLLGPVGFSRTVAIKRLHEQFAQDPEFVSMFLDEARLAARIRHPNVVPTLDVVALEGELFLVMEYVQGEALGALLKALRRRHERVPVRYAVAIVAGALRGLHAAHEATDEQGNPLGIVHRDISPQNILVGIDGVPRVLDFGVAKAAGRIQVTREGQIKGKIAYMPPEQIHARGTDRRTDVYAAGVVLWETLTGTRLFQGENDVAVFAKVLEGSIRPPSELAQDVPPELDAIVLRAVAGSPDARFPDAREMARALDGVVALVPTAEIGEWVEAIGAEQLTARSRTVTRIEVESNASSPRLEAPSPAGPAAPLPEAATSAWQGPELPDAKGIPDDRTEVSAATNVRVAAPPRVGFGRRSLLVALGGFALVVAVGAVARLAMHPGVSASVPPSGSSTPGPVLGADAPSAAAAEPPKAATSAVDPRASSAAREAPIPLPAPIRTAGVSPAAPPDASLARPRRQPALHPLESVLDSRK